MGNSTGRGADWERLVEASAAERLGDISCLPEEVIKKICRVYGDFMTASFVYTGRRWTIFCR